MRVDSPSQAPAESVRLARIAWFISFAVTVVVIAALLLAKSAQAGVGIAAAKPLGAPIATIAFEEEDEEGEFEFEEEEEGEFEEEEAESARRGGPPPAACGLRTARATALADESRSLLQTQLNYTSFAPVDVAIELRLGGGKGSMTVWRARKHLGESGILRASERLGRGKLGKVLAARTFTLSVRVLDAPASCRRYSDRHLRGRRAVGDQVSWVQADSVFGT